MPPRSRIPAPKKIVPDRRWRVSIIRSRAQFLGTVAAPTREAAEAAAVRMFELSAKQRHLLMRLPTGLREAIDRAADADRLPTWLPARKP